METPSSAPETLWAPWRVEYFTAPKNPDFLMQAAQSNDDAGHLVLLRGRYAFLIMNRYPYACGHLMAVPYQKVAEIEALSEGERLELWNLAVIAQKVLRQTVGAQGFNVGLNLGVSAGAGVADHLHLHIVPRREGDHNFMPVLGGTHILPESLEALYARMRTVLEQMPEAVL